MSFFVSPENAQTTKVTIGLGNVTVGGGSNIDEQAQFADLNRDISNSQEITKDVERGGLDANLTVDNRVLSEAGWKDIAEDVEKTNTAVVDGVDYVADEIAVLGNDLSEEYRDQLGETGEELVDDWIRADYTDEQIAEALERDKVQESLANLESIKGKSQEDFLAEVNQQEQSQATETSAQKAISDEDGSHFLDPVEISSNGPTALAVGTDALGKLNQEAQALAEENPVLSSMLSYGFDAVGGPVKAAVGILVDEGLSAVAGDELAQVGEAVTSYVGAKIQNVDVDEYRELRTEEQNDTALYNSLEAGESMINTDDGVGAIATILGVDLGRKGVSLGDKKASSDGGDEDRGSGSDNNVSTNNTANTANTTSVNSPVTPNHNYSYDLVENPGPLSNVRGNPASNFAGGKYNEVELQEDLILYRGGESGKELGQWFTRTPPDSAAQVRIDSAVKSQWIDPETGVLTGQSPIDTVHTIRIPKGTKIYEGPVGSQGGVNVGGQDKMQIFIQQPWRIEGVEVIDSTPLK